MANHVFITDQEGTLLWEGKSSAAFLGLQAGESFWFGSLQDRVWASIMSISYGLDTATGDFHVELVVQEASPKPSKTARTKWKNIDHGEKKTSGRNGGMISIDAGRLVVTVGATVGIGGKVERLTIQLNTAHGPVSTTETDVQAGSAIRLEATESIVVATLAAAEYESSRVRITEHVVEE